MIKDFNPSHPNQTATDSTAPDANTALLNQSRDYFTRIFAGLEVDSHPLYDFAEPLKRTAGPDAAISRDWSRLFAPAAITALLNSTQISAEVLFLAAFSYTLAKFSGQEETFLCFQPAPNRDGILPIHLKINEDLSPAQYLAAVQTTYQETCDHHGWGLCRPGPNARAQCRPAFCL